MGIRSAFKKIVNRQPCSFDKVRKMVTRQLPVPDLDNKKIYIQFVATRGAAGKWVIALASNKMKRIRSSKEYQTSAAAAAESLIKHCGNKTDGANFDTTFLVLRELEETHLKYSGAAPAGEPPHHYMAAFRLLPKQFQEGLEEIYKSRLEKSEILPVKTTSQAASRPPSGPRN